VRPAFIFAASTVAAGVVVTFLPALTLSLAAPCLLVQAVASAVSRWWSGRIGDRLGHSRILAPALVLAGVGLALVLWPHPVALLSGMALFGVGFGATQTATLSLMADRVPPEGHGAVSALWNLAYDVGYSVGPLAGGLVAAALGFPAAFAIVAGVVVFAVPLVCYDSVITKRHSEVTPAQ
jgi:MFS family permease